MLFAGAPRRVEILKSYKPWSITVRLSSKHLTLAIKRHKYKQRNCWVI